MGDEQRETLSFGVFAERLSDGDDAAAAELLARYSDRLLGVARRRLSRRLVTKTDPEDVVQSALRSFYRRLGSGEVELRSWESLSGYLSLLTLRKCQREAERFSTTARDVRREVSFSEASTTGSVRIPQREPTPDEVNVFTDLVEKLSDRLDDRDRRVFLRLLEGATADEIAREIGCSRRTLYRSIAWIREELSAIESKDFDGECGTDPVRNRL